MDDMPQPGALRRGAGFWGFIALMLALMVLFASLGIWQVERLGEKERLITDVDARMDLTPSQLPPLAEWGAFDIEAWNYRPVVVSGTWSPEGTVLVFTSLAEQRGQYSGPGYWVMTPLHLATGGSIFINRGFIPQASAEAFSTGGTIDPGLVSLTGVARATEEVGSFTPAPDKTRRVEWVRNAARLAALAGSLPQPVAPIYIDLPSMGQGTLPQGGETVVTFPNNHMGYATTWFGFTVLIPFLLFFWARRQRGQSAPRP